MRVDAIMQTDLVTTAPDVAVVDVARLLTERRVGACLVMERGELAGVFTERDLVRLVSSGVDVRRRPIREAMTTDVTLAPPDADLLWAAETMRRLGVRHLPVGEGGQVVGIISIRDLYAAAEAVLRLDPRGAETARGVLAAASH
jgi:CBS domain-containing protein